MNWKSSMNVRKIRERNMKQKMKVGREEKKKKLN